MNGWEKGGRRTSTEPECVLRPGVTTKDDEGKKNKCGKKNGCTAIEKG